MKKKAKKVVKKKPKRTIVAEEIELVDSKGRTRALLSTHEETGLPSLSFLDERRWPRVTIGMDLGNRAIFSMAGANGRSFFGCGDDGQGNVGLSLYDENGSPGITFTIRADGERSIQLYDSKLNLVWHASFSGNDKG